MCRDKGVILYCIGLCIMLEMLGVPDVLYILVVQK